MDFLFGFTGREHDAEIDLQYNRARYYDAAIGRWTSEDPIRFEAGDGNLYRYVANTPTTLTDHSGLIQRDRSGNVIFHPVGPAVEVRHPSDPNNPNLVQPGYVLADNGTRIEAFRNLTDDRQFDTDCHGLTFADGDVWINNDQVLAILLGDDYDQTNEPAVGDVVIYLDASRNPVHSATITSISNGAITVSGLGGLETTPREVPIEQGFPGAAGYTIVSAPGPEVDELEDLVREGLRFPAHIPAPCSNMLRRALMGSLTRSW